MDSIYEINNDPLLVRANTINTVDEQNGGASRPDLGKERRGTRDRQAKARGELGPSGAGEPVILQEEDGAVHCGLLSEAHQDGGLPAAWKTTDADDTMKFELFGDNLL